MRTAPTPGPALRRARVAVGTVFFASGVGFASWGARIPAVRSDLGLGDAELGVALLGPAVGALLAMPLSGALVARRGSRPVTRTALAAYCLSLPLPALAPGLPTLTVTLGVAGACNAALDVAMNAQGVAVERGYRRPILSSLHSLFSLGGFAGAGAGGAAAAAGWAPSAHLAAVAAILAGLGLAASTWLVSGDEGRPGSAVLAWPTRPVAVLGIMAFCCLLAEGAAMDWSAVYLRDTLGTGAGAAALAFAAFSVAMAAGRAGGDCLTARLGPTTFVRWAAGLAAAGFALGLLAGRPLAAIAGFAALGAGLSCVVPVIFSTAGRARGMTSGQGIAAVSTVGYLGFLVGPPLIGAVAELAGLRVGLGLVVLLVAVIPVLATALGGDATAGCTGAPRAAVGPTLSRPPSREAAAASCRRT